MISFSDCYMSVCNYYSHSHHHLCTGCIYADHIIIVHRMYADHSASRTFYIYEYIYINDCILLHKDLLESKQLLHMCIDQYKVVHMYRPP